MKEKIIILITLLLMFNPITVYAQRGCCSWHGGVSHCGSNGYYICNDGSQSPSCTCYSSNANDNDNDGYGIELTDTSCPSCPKCECEYNLNDIKNLKTKLQEQENKTSNREVLILFMGIIIIVMYFSKKN